MHPTASVIEMYALYVWMAKCPYFGKFFGLPSWKGNILLPRWVNFNPSVEKYIQTWKMGVNNLFKQNDRATCTETTIKLDSVTFENIYLQNHFSVLLWQYLTSRFSLFCWKSINVLSTNSLQHGYLLQSLLSFEISFYFDNVVTQLRLNFMVWILMTTKFDWWLAHFCYWQLAAVYCLALALMIIPSISVHCIFIPRFNKGS